jgi:hypothetical protein
MILSLISGTKHEYILRFPYAYFSTHVFTEFEFDCLVYNKNKGKVVPMFNSVSCHEEVLGSGGIAPCFKPQQ